MALTFTQTPSNATIDGDEVNVKGQRLILTAFETSGVIRANDGFRYKITITPYIGGVAQDPLDFYVQPNPSGYGIIDVRPILDKISYVDSDYMGTSVHTSPAGALFAHVNANNFHRVDYDLLEAWVVDGVLTDSPTGSTAPPSTSSFRVFAGAVQPKDGYNPDLSVIKSKTGYASAVYVLTQRNWDEWKMTNSYGFTSSDVISIPVFQNDWGCIAALYSGWNELAYEIFDVDGNSLDTYTMSISGGSIDANDLQYIIAYPKALSDNLVLSALGVTPDDHVDDWAYYTLTFGNSSLAVSPTFIFYKECEARYTPIRIGWSNSQGGWDYFNFKSKSTPSYQTEKKTYKRVLGTFGEGYDHNSWDRGIKEFGNTTKRYIEVTESNMTAEKYAFLVDLIRSDNVEFIPTDGSEEFEGLVLENRQYAEEQCIKAEQKVLTLRFRFANDLW